MGSKETRSSRSRLPTAVAPYAVPALPGAPIACPLDWRELGRVEPRQFAVRNIARRLARRDDPWAEIRSDVRSLRQPQRHLAELNGGRSSNGAAE
jgi:bifunctional non-homologous end joining protein LigD